MFNFFSKSDGNVKQDVINELSWDPSINVTKIKVSANNGIVTLEGTVPHFTEKMSAVHATERVGGVKAVADELEVKGSLDKSDEEIAKAAVEALKWNYSVPGNVQVSVNKGWLTLTGEVDWDYQRNSAKYAVSDLLGVYGVTNDIKMKTKAEAGDIKKLIEDAIVRTAKEEGREIQVSVSGDRVTLSGKVRSLAEKQDIQTTTWRAPGVSMVVNNLTLAQQ